MTHITIYFIVSFVALASSIFASWYEGDDLTIGLLIMSVFLSLLPFVNIIVIIASVFQMLGSVHGTVVLKGKKR
jgi:uncharacterized membrane protein